MTSRFGALAMAVVALLYGRAWTFTLQCDDLVLVRPWSSAELWAVWHGTWDPQHAFAVFFRPIVSWFSAGTFELFGVNAHAHMLLSMALLAAVACLLGRFVAQESDSPVIGAITTALFVLHPNTVWSTGVWVTNSTHKLAALAALAALFAWRRARTRPLTRWWPVALWVTIAFLTKEDGLMLIPAILTAQWARARLVGDVSRPSARLLAAGAALGLVLVTWRWLALGELGGFPIPHDPAQLARNLLRGPFFALTLQDMMVGAFSREALLVGIAAAFLVGSMIADLLRHGGPRRWIAALALIVIVWYDLPLLMISNGMRYYMLTMCASALLATVLVHHWQARASRARRAVFAAAVGLIALGTAARQQDALLAFSPCGTAAAECRVWLLENVPQIPPEGRALLMEQPARCAASQSVRLDARDTLTWGLGAVSVDTDTGVQGRDAAADVVALIRPTAMRGTFAWRDRRASSATPVNVRVTINGQQAALIHLTSPEWHEADVRLSSGWRTWVRGMHRADVSFSVGGRPHTGVEWRPLRLPDVP
jgi:hypothetical protein